MLGPQALSNLQELRNSFFRLFAREPRLFSAPGRVNLIGEHTDYNEGFVLPMAADRRTCVAAAARDDSLIRVHSFNLQEQAEFDLSAKGNAKAHWVTYIEGIARVLIGKGVRLRGADLAISSEVPIGAGLSSSAALEISAGFALMKLAGHDIDLMELAIAAQTAEHEYVGTKSGLMDQLTAAFGVKDHAMLIDCRSLERKQTPLNLPSTAIVICDTGVKHELATSAYNERRHECEKAVELLRETLPAVRSLRDVSTEDFKTYGSLLPETLRRRCRHVVSENARTLLAAEALANGEVDRLGELMNQSHESLRHDYEVSCLELDVMVEVARQQSGVAGARMMGGGFGGSTVNLVARDKVEEFSKSVSEGFERRTRVTPEILTVGADDGVHEHGAVY